MSDMARNALVFLLLGGIAAAAGGCAVADTGAFPRLQDEMMALKKDMAALKAGTPPAAPERSDDIQSVRKSYADMNSDVDQLKSDLLATTTRMDEARVEMQR